MAEMMSAHRHDLIASDRVEGTAVYNRQGDRLGKISHFMVDKRSGHVRYALLSFGGFLGMGNEHYPLPWSMLAYDMDKGDYVIELAKEVLEQAPHYLDEDRPAFDDAYGRNVYQYYGLIYPW
ncbi:photosystem reaction center subunit H [Sphingobium yanoikuyae]|jgi:sporulation protein YlmC with PRC-barrel domain|uniref:Photosystem reaction center subunit H n=1 Tax=Sphingobium yanoikuyae TaxID=13690 RepID=A0A177JVL8_SPHYA|nr:PRC-barrel domain-containing protein [Sphingobium yanoikuyae]OAH45289.1 photosystem reaction center subunit H [Sphingobium yanoikuyae]